MKIPHDFTLFRDGQPTQRMTLLDMDVGSDAVGQPMPVDWIVQYGPDGMKTCGPLDAPECFDAATLANLRAYLAKVARTLAAQPPAVANRFTT